VLDHDPTKKDIERFFTRFKAVLDARGLILHGITTDGSPLYPEPIAQVFGDIPHQICEFHVIAELTKAVLKAVTKARNACRKSWPTYSIIVSCSCSNAVERGNRRHRKMQKSIYGVRTHHTLVGRMALDHIRDWYIVANTLTLFVLHKTRPGRRTSRKENRVLSLPISVHKSLPLPKAG